MDGSHGWQIPYFLGNKIEELARREVPSEDISLQNYLAQLLGGEAHFDVKNGRELHVHTCLEK